MLRFRWSIPFPARTHTKPMNATEHQTLIEMSFFLHVLGLGYRLRKPNVILSPAVRSRNLLGDSLWVLLYWWASILEKGGSLKNVYCSARDEGFSIQGRDVQIPYSNLMQLSVLVPNTSPLVTDKKEMEISHTSFKFSTHWPNSLIGCLNPTP